MLVLFRNSIARRILALTISIAGLTSFCIAQDEAAPAVDLPDGKAIYEQYLEATGGREKFETLKSSRMKGSMKVQGMDAPIVINRARPGKLTINIQFEGVGDVSQGTNGDIAWDVSPMRGAVLLDGTEKDEMMKRADFDEEINPEKYYKQIKCVEEGTVDEQKCYVVEFTDNNDNVESRFFDAESHLLVKVETKRDTPLGKMKVESKLSDYREVDGVKLAFKNEMSVMGTTQLIEYDEIEFNIEHEEGSFDPPEAVAKLIEKKKAKESGDDEDDSAK